MLHILKEARVKKNEQEMWESVLQGKIDIVFLQGLESLRKNTANIGYHHEVNDNG